MLLNNTNKPLHICYTLLYIRGIYHISYFTLIFVRLLFCFFVLTVYKKELIIHLYLFEYFLQIYFIKGIFNREAGVAKRHPSGTILHVCTLCVGHWSRLPTDEVSKITGIGLM